MKQIETERLILRRWQFSDSKDLFEYAHTDLVGPNAGWKPHVNEEESIQIIEHFRSGDSEYAVELKADHKVIGGVGLFKRTEGESAEVGFVLNSNYWGYGYIPEAVEAIKTFAFEELKLDEVWCAYFDFNDRSRRVNEKCGFIYDHTKSEVLAQLDNKPVTTLFYKITKEDYFK